MTLPYYPKPSLSVQFRSVLATYTGNGSLRSYWVTVFDSIFTEDTELETGVIKPGTFLHVKRPLNE